MILFFLQAAVFLGACLVPFDYTVRCDPKSPADGCSCTDVEWNPADRAETYRVERETLSSGARVVVGSVVAQEVEGEFIPPSTFWNVTRDSIAPRLRTPYRYRIRACNSAGCSAWSDPVENRTPPYICFAGATPREIPCYVGASCLIPSPRGCNPGGIP